MPYTNGQKTNYPEFAFGGGREFVFPDGSTLRSSNITPDADAGIGKWTEETFIQRFKAYADSTYIPADIGPGEGEYNSIMPWTMYGKMESEDLSAIYRYLKTVKPLAQKVTKFSAASLL